MSDYDNGEFDDNSEDWGDLPDNIVQDASDAFNFLGYEFDRDSIHSMSELDDRGDRRETGYETPFDALDYWYRDGWDELPDFAELYYDPEDDMYYWVVDEDTA